VVVVAMPLVELLTFTLNFLCIS